MTISVNDPIGPPLVNSPNVVVTRSGVGGKDYTTKTAPPNQAWYLVEAFTAKKMVQLPNGMVLNASPAAGERDKALLTAWEYAQIAPSAFGTFLFDRGIITGLTLTVTDASMSLASDATEQAVLVAAGTGGSINLIGMPGAVFTSSDPTKATVDQTGLITAKAVGSTNIGATWDRFTATPVAVTVAA